MCLVKVIIRFCHSYQTGYQHRQINHHHGKQTPHKKLLFAINRQSPAPLQDLYDDDAQKQSVAFHHYPNNRQHPSPSLITSDSFLVFR
jgi:hypothetical protein